MRKEMMGAYAELYILLIVKKKETYGYEIMSELKEISSGKIIWKEGSLYPVLKKMEEKKFIKSYWDIKNFDRPRKYYKILKAGLNQIELLFEERKLVEKIINELQKS